jgi:hypothetical protein
VSEDLDRSTGHREIDDPPDGDVFNFTGVPSGTDLRASLGLNEQKLARAFNELDQAGPRLADLGTYLSKRCPNANIGATASGFISGPAHHAHVGAHKDD